MLVSKKKYAKLIKFLDKLNYFISNYNIILLTIFNRYKNRSKELVAQHTLLSTILSVFGLATRFITCQRPSAKAFDPSQAILSEG
jgi:hypothetical protein